MTLHTIANIANVYVDAVVSDDKSQLLFLSVWGLDTAIQELLAKLTLPLSSGGMRYLRVNHTNTECVWHFVDKPNTLVKLTGRSANPAAHVNGLVQLWLFDPLATQLDYAAHRGLLLKRQDEDEVAFAERYWATVQAICPVPLLPEWQEIVKTFEGYGWIQHHRGLHVDAYSLDFSGEDVEKRISQCIQSGQFTLPLKTH